MEGIPATTSPFAQSGTYLFRGHERMSVEVWLDLQYPLLSTSLSKVCPLPPEQSAPDTQAWQVPCSWK